MTRHSDPDLMRPAELEKQAARPGGPRRRDLVSLRASVAPVLVRTSRFVRRRLGVHPRMLVGDDAGDRARCRTIARQQVRDGPWRAILAPSAALDGAVSLMLHVACTDGIRELADDPDRVTIAPGFRWPVP